MTPVSYWFSTVNTSLMIWCVQAIRVYTTLDEKNSCVSLCWGYTRSLHFAGKCFVTSSTLFKLLIRVWQQASILQSGSWAQCTLSVDLAGDHVSRGWPSSLVQDQETLFPPKLMLKCDSVTELRDGTLRSDSPGGLYPQEWTNATITTPAHHESRFLAKGQV